MDISDGLSELSVDEHMQAIVRPPPLQRTPSGALSSPSSPNLGLVTRPRQLSRSHTMPRIPHVSNQRVPDIESLRENPTLAARIRRWMLGLAVGR